MLYRLVNGELLYCEKVVESSYGLEFKAKDACWVELHADPKDPRRVGIAAQRCDKRMFGINSIRVPTSSILMVHDVTDQRMLRSFWIEISGIVAPSASDLNAIKNQSLQ